MQVKIDEVQHQTTNQTLFQYANKDLRSPTSNLNIETNMKIKIKP